MLENEYYENVAHVGEGHQAALMVRINMIWEIYIRN